jgi:GTP-binding protein EngB required for normal cell division
MTDPVTADQAPSDVFEGEPSDVKRRLDGLSQAVTASEGRIDEEILAPARMLTQRAAERLKLSGEHTIVALAGATGSGKSSLFNALTELDLAGVGVRRPTTSWALACAWGPDGAGELLEWMGIPPRHQVSRTSMLDQRDSETSLEGLVLLDLPDHDSTEVAHHVEMDRLIKYADVLVWVLDPQKYADAAIHDRYIRPMAGYADVTLVVLNQIDRIPADQRERALADVQRILADEGLPDVPVIGVSATQGDGVDDVRRELATRIKAKASAKGRLGSDIAAAADVMAQVGGTSQAQGLTPADRLALEQALLQAAGVPETVEAIGASVQRRAAFKTDWPVVRWLADRGESSIDLLDLDEDVSAGALAERALPQVSSISRANAQIAVRDAATKASAGLERPWREAVQMAPALRDGDVVDELQAALASAKVDVAKPAAWWGAVQAIQWVALAASVIGALWWIVMGVGKVASFDVPGGPSWLGLPLPGLLCIGGVVAGLVLTAVGRAAASASGRAKAARAERELTSAVVSVATERVVEPLTSELERYGTYREGLLTALK